MSHTHPDLLPDDARGWIAAVRQGSMSRRSLLRRSLALGLTAPVIAQVLAACGGDDDDDATTEPTAGTAAEPTATTAAAPAATATTATEPAAEGGGGGMLRIDQWQAPTILNPHLSTGYKDYDAARIAYETLADFDQDGNPEAMLAAEFPTVANGGVSEDGMSVTWTLRSGVVWHDGTPFTAEDVRFTWQYATNAEVGAVTGSVFAPVSDVEVIDDTTVTVHFAEPNPAGFEIFTGRNGMIIPKHIFEEFMNAEARNAPANLTPVGTGPFKVTEFRPGDVVLYERNEMYWDPGKPYFDQVELKGGGDATASARAVLQTGEADFAWAVAGDAAVLAEMEQSGAGLRIKSLNITGDRVAIQFADPNTETDGARAEPGTLHPLFQHLAARQAIAYCIPRDVLAENVYGSGAVPTSNNLAAPARFASPNTQWEYDIEKAKASLAESGVEPGKLLFQTSQSAARQNTQAVIKQELDKLGFEVELKAIDPAVFFSSDVGNPDTYTKFYADLEIFTYAPDSLYPINYMDRYRSDKANAKANNWSNRNVTRYQNPEYDALHDQAKVEMDPDKQNELFIAMNDLSVADVAEIPLVISGGGGAASTRLVGNTPTPWTGPYHDIKDWKWND